MSSSMDVVDSALESRIHQLTLNGSGGVQAAAHSEATSAVAAESANDKGLRR
jgi:hypothetical protein